MTMSVAQNEIVNGVRVELCMDATMNKLRGDQDRPRYV